MSGSIRALIVEDDEDIANILKIQLERSGHSVDTISDGQAALNFIERATSLPHIFLLDRMLPNISGVEICKFLRQSEATATHPILLITALTSPEQIVEGLDAGADDYVTKPFDINVVMARVRSLLRRREKRREKAGQRLSLGEIVLHADQCKTWLGEEEIHLTLSEYKLLHTFLKSPGKVFTRNQLVEAIMDGPIHVTHRTIDTHIFGLRKKLKHHAKMIETIRGIGYRIASSL